MSDPLRLDSPVSLDLEREALTEVIHCQREGVVRALVAFQYLDAVVRIAACHRTGLAVPVVENCGEQWSVPFDSTASLGGDERGLLVTQQFRQFPLSIAR